MQGVSLSLNGLSPTRGWAHAASGRKHDVESARHCDGGSVAISDKWAGISTSITNLRMRLDSLATSASSSATEGQAGGLAGFDAQIVSKQRGELQIHTQEGDVITLKFSNKLTANLTSQQTSQDGVTQQSASLDVRSHSRVSVQVEGDLNSDELAAITDLVGKVDDLASKFYSGGFDAALAQSTNLAYDTTQLAGYSLDLRLKQSIRAYSVDIPSLAVPAPAVEPSVESPPVDAAPAPVAAVPDNSSQVAAVPELPVETVNAPVVVADPVVAVAGTPPTTVDAPAAAPVVDAPQPGNSTQSVVEFAAQVRAAFAIHAGDASLGFSYDFKIHLLIASIAASAPADAAAATQPASGSSIAA